MGLWGPTHSGAQAPLAVDGEATAARRDDDGNLWLQSTQSVDSTEEGRVEIEVYRKLTDGVPFAVTTRLTVRVSGEPREIVLGSLELAGLVPTELRSDLAARLAPDTGSLTVQARPGTFTIEVVSRGATPLSSLRPPEQSEPWPNEEVWVWEPDETLRQVELSGANAVDAARTNLPSEWQNRTALLLTPEREIRLETTRRGEPSPPPNALSLHREIWLDMDGQGVTGHDELSGALNRGWRLDLTEGELGRVSLNDQDLLITTNEGHRGVEIRNRRLDSFAADWRMADASSSLPAVGWSDDVQSLRTTLHLPPGWTLLRQARRDRVTALVTPIASGAVPARATP